MTVWFEKGRGRGKKKIDGVWVTGGYRFDFWLFNDRHTSPRGWDTEQEALDAEAELRRALRRQRAGLEPLVRALSPTFAEAAGAYYAFAKDKQLVSDLDGLDNTQFVILQFFGERPSDQTKLRDGAPYHNIRLQDPIDDPRWILKFDDWLNKRGIAGPTKNRYRSACSRLYWFAMLPERRVESGITVNPFRGLQRDPEYPRDVVLAANEIRAIIAAAPYHLRLAIVIAALAPKLRLSNILQLRWDTSFDRDFTIIRVTEHKTRRATKRPMVTVISLQLRLILLAAREIRKRNTPWVISFRRRRVGAVLRAAPIKSIVKALIDACATAGITYGRTNNGATFHTIRHSAATLLAGLGVAERLHANVMGHKSIQTTQGYTHLRPVHEQAPLEQLSEQLPLQDVVFEPRRAGGGTAGGSTLAKRDPQRPRPDRRNKTSDQRENRPRSAPTRRSR